MRQNIEIKLKLFLCDRNRNFGEIMESVYKSIKDRDGVDEVILLEEKWEE